MRDIEQVTEELKEGATLIINSHQDGKIDRCNAYVVKDGKEEEIEILKVFIKYMYILNEVHDDKSFKLTKNQETGVYLSGIYNKGELIQEKTGLSTYLFDSIEELNDNLKGIEKIKRKKLGGIYGRN